MSNIRSSVRAAGAAGIALALALVSSACGSTDGEPTPAEPAPAISVPADLRMSDDDGSDDDGSEGGSPEVSEECAELVAAWSEMNRALAGINEEHPRLVVAGFREAHRSATSVDAPEVQGWDQMTSYLSRAVGAFEDIDTDDAGEVATTLARTFSDVDTARAATAHEQVTAYLAAGCQG